MLARIKIGGINYVNTNQKYRKIQKYTCGPLKRFKIAALPIQK